MSSEGVIIVGFDILPSRSSSSKRAPKFACVVTRDEVVLNEYHEISRGALLKLVRDIAPNWLCTDNIFEIVPDTKSLFHLVERIPSNTRIVQVTGVPPRQTPLKILAKRHGLLARGKPTPLESARIAAQLAARGVGYALECFSEQTEIKVTRGRKPGRGGQSANRFRRRVHSQIQQMTRFIESEIKTAGIDYDIDIRESDFGYASARLVTYAPLPTINKIIKSKRGGDFNILISPVRKRVEFVRLEPRQVALIKPKYFILGIDPGTTAAYCLLSLDGHVRNLRSRKGLTRADMIREVYENGIPAIVASDVPQAPHFVEKFASTVNAPIFTPKKPIAVADKQELAREYGTEKRIRNAHERDALTAAVYAYRFLLPKLEQIDSIVREQQLSVDRNYLKALVIKGTSINEAIAQIERESAEIIETVPEQLPVEEDEPLSQERFDALYTKMDHMESENKILLDRIEDLQRHVEYLKFRESELSDNLEIVSDENYWKVKRDREISKNQSALTKSQQEVASLTKEVKDLRKHLERLKGVKRLEMRGDMLAVKVIPHFTRESIEEYAKKVGLKNNDIVLFEDASGGGPQTAGILIDHEIRAVVVDTALSHLPRDELIKAMIPVIDAEQVELQRVDEFAFISRGKFEQQLQTFIKSVREQARQKGEDQLVELIERYRREIER